MEVLGWQIGIILGISVAALLFGRTGLIVASLGATAWTVIEIFTSWLMILQLVSIALGSLEGLGIADHARAAKRRKAAWSVAVIGSIAIWQIGNWLEKQDPNVADTRVIAEQPPLISTSGRPTQVKARTLPDASVQRPAERSDYHQLLDYYESLHPQIDPRSTRYDDKVAAVIAERVDKFQSIGLTPSQALQHVVTNFDWSGKVKREIPSGCRDRYSETINAIEADVPLGQYATIRSAAQAELERCAAEE